MRRHFLPYPHGNTQLRATISLKRRDMISGLESVHGLNVARACTTRRGMSKTRTDRCFEVVGPHARTQNRTVSHVPKCCPFMLVMTSRVDRR
jgi:hypothetical protein